MQKEIKHRTKSNPPKRRRGGAHSQMSLLIPQRRQQIAGRTANQNQQPAHPPPVKHGCNRSKQSQGRQVPQQMNPIRMQQQGGDASKAFTTQNLGGICAKGFDKSLVFITRRNQGVN